jgi:hypothetical protein
MTLYEHFENIIEPAVRAYRAAEATLSDCVLNGDEALVEIARADVLRCARIASIELHQFADWVKGHQPSWLPSSDMKIDSIRQWVQRDHCRFLRNENVPINDIDLLHDVADAFKHFELTHEPKNRTRLVTSAGATVFLGSAWGTMRWGEGKYGGVEQLMVQLAGDENRAMSSVLQNVLDAWRRAMGRELPPVGE